MKVKIIFNKKKPWAKELAKEVEKLLKEKKYSIVKRNADATILIGGDGTIFYNRDIIEGKIIGIGSEKSFVCQLTRESWEDVILFLRSKKVEKRITLDAFINGKKVGWAINDVVIHSRNFRVIRITLEIDEIEEEFEGDGIIFATPTGSTAYALSAGGAILQRDLKAYEIVPIAPYLREAFPVVTALPSKAQIKGWATLILDGQDNIKLKSGDLIEVKIGKEISFATV